MPPRAPAWTDSRRLPPWSLLAALAIGVRVVAALVLLFGPWTDDAEELEGWDVARFQEIADAPGTPYVDHDVEYPPLTVVVAELVLADDVVSSHRVLVVLSLAVDLGLAAVLARWWRPPVASAYLLLGLPMVPSGLLRLDLWAALAAVIAAAALVGGGPSAQTAPQRRRDALAASAIVIGAMVKVWPVLLVAAAVGIGRRRAAAWSVGTGVTAGVLWLAVSGTGAIEQITSLRGVTGWHLESIPGNLAALVSDEAPRLEADAFRIGELDDSIVLAGRIVTVGAIITAAGLARRSLLGADQRLALVMLASTAMLIVTAPLVSPQFMLWLTPWAAMLFRDRVLVGLTALVVAITAGILALFGPPELDHPVAATALLTRNGLLLAIAGVAVHRLARTPWFTTTPLHQGSRTGG